MSIKTKSKPKNNKRTSFFDIAEKHIIKNKNWVKRNASTEVDIVVYGISVK